jgi:hypothetical protein
MVSRSRTRQTSGSCRWVARLAKHTLPSMLYGSAGDCAPNAFSFVLALPSRGCSDTPLAG